MLQNGCFSHTDRNFSKAYWGSLGGQKFSCIDSLPGRHVFRSSLPQKADLILRPSSCPEHDIDSMFPSHPNAVALASLTQFVSVLSKGWADTKTRNETENNEILSTKWCIFFEQHIENFRPNAVNFVDRCDIKGKGTVIYSRNCQDVCLSLLIIFLRATYFLTGYQLPEKYSYRDLAIARLSSILTWSVRKWVWIKGFETCSNKTNQNTYLEEKVKKTFQEENKYITMERKRFMQSFWAKTVFKTWKKQRTEWRK